MAGGHLEVSACCHERAGANATLVAGRRLGRHARRVATTVEEPKSQGRRRGVHGRSVAAALVGQPDVLAHEHGAGAYRAGSPAAHPNLDQRALPKSQGATSAGSVHSAPGSPFFTVHPNPSMAQVHATLGNARLLDTFFERLEQICILIETLAHNANTELARDMIATSRLNVLLYGRSGSRKSTPDPDPDPDPNPDPDRNPDRNPDPDPNPNPNPSPKPEQVGQEHADRHADQQHRGRAGQHQPALHWRSLGHRHITS